MLSLEALAKAEIRAKLAAYQALSSEQARRLIVSSFHDGSDIVFELYVPGKEPKDALLIAKAVIDKRSRDIVVKVYNLSKKIATHKQNTIEIRSQSYMLSNRVINTISQSKIAENLSGNRFEKNFRKVHAARNSDEINNLVIMSASDHVSHEKTSHAMLNKIMTAPALEAR